MYSDIDLSKKICIRYILFCKSNQSIAKRFLREKLRKDIGLRFCNFGSKMVKNRRTEKVFFVFATHCSPSAHLPLPFRSPSAPLLLRFFWHFCGYFLWTLFVDTFCGHFMWTLSFHFFPFCYRCYYPHRPRDSLSPVCGILKLQIASLVFGRVTKAR